MILPGIMGGLLLGQAAAGGVTLPAGMKHHYDLSDAATLTLSGSSITSLADKSGNGYTLSQGTATKQPQTTTLNGRGAALFDGVDDFLFGPLDAAFSGDDKPFTLAFAAQLTAVDAATYDAVAFNRHLIHAGSPYYAFRRTSAGLWAAHKRDDVEISKTASAGTVDAAVHALVFVCTGTAVDIYEDGVQIGSGLDFDGGNTSVSRFTLGAWFQVTSEFNQWAGSIGEAVAYSSALTGDDLTNLLGYMGDKWLPA